MIIHANSYAEMGTLKGPWKTGRELCINFKWGHHNSLRLMEKVAFDFWEWKNVEETEVVSQSFIRERNSRERPDNYLKAKLVRHF